MNVARTESLEQRLYEVLARIRQAEQQFQRTPGEVKLLAVSKTHPIEAIQQALAAGQHLFGESYLQEALPKISALRHAAPEWHFIGPIQSNKTAAIASHFDWVHSVDRLKIAQRLNDQRPPELAPLNICIQVNVSGEASKSGLAPAEVLTLAQQITELPKLCLRGLMTIPAPASTIASQRIPFRAMRELKEQIQTAGIYLDTLSMGMSDDLEAAIAEGATIVRIGTAIFGQRTYD